MWTKKDQAFLRSLGIQAGDPPPALPPLPRFRVVPIAMKGWYRIVDGVRRRPFLDFSPEHFPDPRAAAEDDARQQNERPQAGLKE